MIKEFRGKYHFLSNFSYSPFTQDEVNYPTVEHFFQAMKTTNIEKRIEVANSRTAGMAKRKGRQILLRPNWNTIRNEMMMLGLMNKFLKNHDLAKKLIATAPHTLEEGNSHGDVYWGKNIKTGIGENMLGKMLMTIRNLLIEGTL